MSVFLALPPAVVLAVPPQAPSLPPIPPAVRAMLDAAIASGNAGDVAVIVKYAKAADPDSAPQVVEIAGNWANKQAAQKRDVIEHASWLALWTGKAELGGTFSTGNTRTTGLSAAVNLTREGLQWRHKFQLQADYQSTDGITTREHFLADYEPNYKLDDRHYLYGQAQYESDKFLGYNERVSASFGAGLNAIRRDDVKLDLELGPAYRSTAFTDDVTESSIAARGSLDFSWKLTRALSLTQAASAYLEHFNSTVSGTTALNAKLLGPLSAQLSYNVQYESMPPAGSYSTDTSGRAALVYSF